ncbi:hypothetical protein RB620_27370 [Paenibacillus sp. LHD-117]|uniref:hypothetical protein n=1 Tax=Paenibacillus sp. LHD-117 TaxID=3071412 RepID=UPI0027DF1817|nr:hypothetical protein [Paenibacillus sp. LHD-117]MDQ6423155.1 hypothetical protein [Paenibacillus sp. LHD-117]
MLDRLAFCSALTEVRQCGWELPSPGTAIPVVHTAFFLRMKANLPIPANVQDF